MSTESTEGRPQRLAELEAGDALRAWGVATVVIFHIAAGIVLLDTGTYDFREAYGRVIASVILGVQANIYMFFGLSAFLLSRPYARAALQPGTSSFPSTSRYIRHRVGRIIPAFWTTVAVIVIAYGMQGSGIKELIAVLGFAQVYYHGQVAVLIDHAWSIDVEALFYVLLVPLGWASVWMMRRWNQWGGVAAAGLILLVVAVGTALEDWGIDPVIPTSQSPLGGLRSFVPGVILAVLAVRHPGPEFWLRLPRYTSSVLLVIGLFLSWRMPHWAPEGDNLRLYVGTASGGCVLAAAVIRQYRGTPMWRLLRGPVVSWIGVRSYSIYLVHGVVFWALRDIGDGQPTTLRRLGVALLVMLPAVALAAQALFVLVERPAMLYARRKRPALSGPIRPEAPDPAVPDAAVPVAAGTAGAPKSLG